MSNVIKAESSSGIFRIQKSNNFSVISNEALQDSRLSFGARGILAYLLTRPDNWQVSTKHLIAQSVDLAIPSKAGRTAILRMLKELEVCGYLIRKRTRLEGGRYGWITFVYESPQSGNRTEVDSPQCGYPTEGNLTTKQVLIKEKEKTANGFRRNPSRHLESGSYGLDDVEEKVADARLARVRGRRGAKATIKGRKRVPTDFSQREAQAQ